MKRRHVFRAIIFSLLMTVAVSPAVYANTVSRSAKVKTVSKYDDSFVTDRGTYYAAGSASTATTSMISISSATLYGNIYTAEHNYSTGKVKYSSNIAVVLSPGATASREIDRNKDSEVVDYIHSVNTYYTSSKTSSTLADSYTYTAMQYYR